MIDPRDGKIKYFVQKCFPFGSSISCLHYQHFSNVLRHLLEFKTGTKPEPGRISGKKGAATNYLDDFLFLAWTRWFCNNMIQSFLYLCSILGIPVALEKMEWADTLIVFLGILLEWRKQNVVNSAGKTGKGSAITQ